LDSERVKVKKKIQMKDEETRLKKNCAGSRTLEPRSKKKKMQNMRKAGYRRRD